jgi:hypothetical protein
VRTTKYGFLLCPMRPESGGELYLELSGSIGLADDTKPDDLTFDAAITTSWQVVCTEGHTLASGDSENTEPFDFAAFVRTWGSPEEEKRR